MKIINVVPSVREFYNRDPWPEIVEDTLLYGSMKFSNEFSDGTKIPLPGSSDGFRKSVGAPKGQKMDWRIHVDGTDRCVHVLEFHDRFETHVDNYDPGVKPIQHLILDTALGTVLETAEAGIRLASLAVAGLSMLYFGRLP